MECIFCKINSGRTPCFSIYKNKYCHAILDKFKLNKSHILILSTSHKQSITELTNIERTELINLACTVSIALKKVDQQIKDFHFLVNDGPHANQHIPHAHLHIIPRYRFDTFNLIFNFLTRYINPLNYSNQKNKKQYWIKKLKNEIINNL